MHLVQSVPDARASQVCPHCLLRKNQHMPLVILVITKIESYEEINLTFCVDRAFLLDLQGSRGKTNQGSGVEESRSCTPDYYGLSQALPLTASNCGGRARRAVLRSGGVSFKPNWIGPILGFLAAALLALMIAILGMPVPRSVPFSSMTIVCRAGVGTRR